MITTVKPITILAVSSMWFFLTGLSIVEKTLEESIKTTEIIAVYNNVTLIKKRGDYYIYSGELELSLLNKSAPANIVFCSKLVSDYIINVNSYLVFLDTITENTQEFIDSAGCNHYLSFWQQTMYPVVKNLVDSQDQSVLISRPGILDRYQKTGEIIFTDYDLHIAVELKHIIDELQNIADSTR